MEKYIIIKKEAYKVEAESREEALSKYSCGEMFFQDVDCYAIELDFGGGENEQSGKA